MRNRIQQQVLLELPAMFGEQNAYKKFFKAFYKKTNRFACQFVRATETAEETLSDVFANLLKKSVGLIEIEKLKAYFYSAVKNLSVKHTAGNNRNDLHSLNELSSDVFFNGTYAIPENLCISTAMATAINSAIQKSVCYKRVENEIYFKPGKNYHCNGNR